MDKKFLNLTAHLALSEEYYRYAQMEYKVLYIVNTERTMGVFTLSSDHFLYQLDRIIVICNMVSVVHCTF